VKFDSAAGVMKMPAEAGIFSCGTVVLTAVDLAENCSAFSTLLTRLGALD